MAEEYVGFYVQDIEFRSQVVPVQTPLRMCLSMALAGYVPPAFEKPFTYCDICCGDGKTVNALASLNKESIFYGIDFNPNHIAKAKKTAEALGLTNVNFIHASIADIVFEDFPTFDFITINGAYSWLEEPLKQKVLQFVSSRLKDNGIFYVEYMALPGRVAIAPLWKLIQMLTPPEKFSSSKERGKRGIYLLRLLARRGMFYLQANPPAARAAQFYLTQTKNDEYFIDHFIHNALASGFRPMFFYEMNADITKNELRYIGAVDPSLNDIEVSVPPSQIPTFFEIAETEMLETVKDFIRNTMDRRDLFSKKPVQSIDDALAYLKERIKIFPSVPVNEVRRVLNIIGGHRIPLKGGIYDKIFKLFEEGKTCITIEDLNEFPPKQIIKAITRILATGDFTASYKEPFECPQDYEQRSYSVANDINKILIDESFESFTSSVLVSPITFGAGAELTNLEVAVLKSLLTKNNENLVEQLSEVLSKIEKPVQTFTGTKNANTLKTDEIQQIVSAFMKRKLPLLIKLGILNC
jgi:SAM-dependent methyltransferase